MNTITADEYAELLRAHTRAIWALKGETDYPEDEQQEMAQHASWVLRCARQDEAEAV